MTPRASDDEFVLTLWTSDTDLARKADAAGVHRIGVDLDRLGKAERQRGRHTWISPHTVDDLAALAPMLGRAHLFARVNPMNPGTPDEIEAVLAARARVVMLPMAATAHDAAAFAAAVDGRARVVLLVESRDGLDRLADLVEVDGIDEVHLGLNDLALSLGLANRWLTLAGDVVLRAAERVRLAGLRFGMGGIGRAFDESLPLRSDLIYAEYARTGAAGAVLARSFRADASTDLAGDVERALGRLAYWRRATGDALADAHEELGRRARTLTLW